VRMRRVWWLPLLALVMAGCAAKTVACQKCDLGAGPDLTVPLPFEDLAGVGPGDMGMATDLSGGGDLSGPSADMTVVKHRLDLCASDSECATPLVCRASFKSGPMRCTKSCTMNADCLSGERCLPDALGGNTCQVSDTGRTCAVANDCAFGCLLSQKYCTTECVTGSDCPNGFGCQPVGSPSVRACVKVEAYCDSTNTSACIASSACDTSASLVVSGCTIACSTSSDCPQRAIGMAAWTCNGSGICKRPGDVYGPLGQATPAQYACNPAHTATINICNDTQHIDFTKFTIPAVPTVSCSATNTTDGVAGDSCVDSCRYQGGCMFGFSCTALGSLGAGSRIGLCLPSQGGNEVGQACTTDSQCAFGYCARTLGVCSRDCTFDGVCPSGSTCLAGSAPAVEGLPFRFCQ